jgi:hypothetical protein
MRRKAVERSHDSRVVAGWEANLFGRVRRGET